MQSCPGRRAAVAGDERTTNAVDGRVPRPFAGKIDALILDHAGNTLGHGKLEDFEPPAELSTIEKRKDKRAGAALPTPGSALQCHQSDTRRHLHGVRDAAA